MRLLDWIFPMAIGIMSIFSMPKDRTRGDSSQGFPPTLQSPRPDNTAEAKRGDVDSKVVSCLLGPAYRGAAVGVKPDNMPSPPPALFAAIRMVEGDDGQVGPAGERGPYQCSRAAWQDSCEWLGIELDYDTYVWDREATEKIMLGYWHRYNCITDEQRARCWNGGPHGHKRTATLKYLKKVQEAMK